MTRIWHDADGNCIDHTYGEMIGCKELDNQDYKYPWASLPLVITTDLDLSIEATDEMRELKREGLMPDLLMTMYTKQQAHAREYCKPEHAHGQLELPIDPADFGDWSKRSVHESFRRSMSWAVEELVEAYGLFKGKPWKKNFQAPDRQQVVGEIADAFHFFLEALIVAGITPGELFEAYFREAKKNDERRENNY